MSLTGRRRRRCPGRTGRRSSTAAAALAFLLAASACSGDDDALTDAATTSTRPARNTTTSTTGAASSSEQHIIERYQAFWKARFEANTHPVNPDHPGLLEYATGAQLENVLTETRQRKEKGLAFRQPERSITERRVKVVAVEGDEASLQDCAINDGIVYELETGEIVDDSVVTRNVTATMRRVDGEWRLGERKRPPLCG